MAPRSVPTAIPGFAFAFITTTVHDPSVASQTTSCVPVPVAEATQKVCEGGAAGVVSPATCSTFASETPEITVRLTPARYRSTSLEGPIPTNNAWSVVGVTRIRTSSITSGEYSQPTPADPSSVDSVASADPELEKSCRSVVT